MDSMAKRKYALLNEHDMYPGEKSPFTRYNDLFCKNEP